jgi:aerobic-type carbon monoxide dehydrogenase small subunit (CoxS/CutS family)
MSREKTITLTINGRAEVASVPPHRTLLAALRDLGHVEVKWLREGRLRSLRGAGRRPGGG